MLWHEDATNPAAILAIGPQDFVGPWILVGPWLLPPVQALAQPRPAEPARKTEEIGSWIVVCARTARQEPPDCDIRHRSWLLPPAAGRPSAALEIQLRHGFPVPVIAVHGVTIPAASGAVLALATDATVQFGAAPPIRLPCDFTPDTLSCAPARPDAQAASARLSQARHAVIRLHLVVPANLKAPVSIPDQQRSLDLVRTAEAASRIQPAGAAADTRWDLRDLLDWLARQLGFTGGLEDALRWLLGQAATLQKGGG